MIIKNKKKSKITSHKYTTLRRYNKSKSLKMYPFTITTPSYKNEITNTVNKKQAGIYFRTRMARMRILSSDNKAATFLTVYKWAYIYLENSEPIMNCQSSDSRYLLNWLRITNFYHLLVNLLKC